jgi:hypothetical protein
MIRRAAGPILVALVLLAACKAQKTAFYSRVFTCDPNVGNTCGTTQAGDPMVCYSAKTLGGTGFCTETCDPNDTSMARSGVVCAAVTIGQDDGGSARSGAVLTECAPSAPDGCPEGLTCYRTGLTEDKGVCLAMPVCASMADCTQSRPVCAADVIKGAVPPAVLPMLATDHLHCLAVRCKSAGMACGQGEGCIGSFLNFGSAIDDLCVPTCDLHNACPPNFTCLQDAKWAPGAPPICFPGMLGTRCAEPDDCLMGTCTDVGVEFNVCTIPCAHDEECAALSTPTDVYTCAKNDRGGHCLTVRPFSGSNCASDSDCIPSQRCVGGSVTGTLKHGECRVPCDADGKCPARGGLPHTCLGKNREGLCIPSSFATPCDTQADCTASFKCLEAAPDPRTPQTSYATHICTVTCTTDADCDANVWTKKLGFCQSGICRLAGGEGVSCDRKKQCGSARCEGPPGSTDPMDPKTCVPALTQ